VSVLPFVVITVVTGSLSLLLWRRLWISAAIGVAGLLAALVAALTIHPESSEAIAGVGVAGSDYLRLLLALGCVASLLVLVVGAATTWSGRVPGGTLLALACVALALAVTDVFTAIVALTGGAVAALLAALPARPADRSVLVAARELRAYVVAAALALVAVAGVASAGERFESAVLGVGYLAVAGATAVRLAAIPFHLRAARLAEAAPGVALPLAMAIVPAAFALVSLGWAHAAVAPLGEPLPAERALILLVAGASILFGTIAALLHEDLEHVFAYSVVADAGVGLLALATLDPAAAGPLRMWLLAFVASRAALGAWIVAVHAGYGRQRLGQLSGWARRAPLLAIALAAVAVAGAGWPGAAIFAARRDLAFGASDGPIGFLLLATSLGSAAIYGRLLAVGLGQRSEAVRAAPAWLPMRRRAAPTGAGRGAAVAGTLIPYRAAVAGTAVLVLAALAVVVGAGGLGAREAAEAAAPALTVPGAPVPSPG
jgi:NADH:ubiquinone oxidoreductase subunit 2 (subunit N)